MSGIIEHADLSKPVYDRLKQMIENGKLSPGQKLIQEKLAIALGVSRTPLLKALRQLEYEMIVESIPRRGMYVKEFSLQEMIDVYDCREAIECKAVRLAIDRASGHELLKLKNIFEPFTSNPAIDPDKYRMADENFHDMIIDLSKNPVLKRMSIVSEVYKRVYRFGLIRPPEETMIEHIHIVEAILERDAETAEQELKNHIGLSRKKLVQYKSDKQKKT